MHKNRAKVGICIAFGLSVIALEVGAVFLIYNRNFLPAPDGEMVFDGDSQELQATEVVPTLDTPIPEGKNAVWCASFLAAWKTLEADLAKEPIALEGNPQVAQALNEAADPRPHIPEQCLYTAAGWIDKGIVEQIARDLAKKFPYKTPPDFSGLLPDSFVAYAYLEADAKFAIPYFQNHEPLEFTDSVGNKTKLNSFGVRHKDGHDFFKLRRQPEILFLSRDKEHKLAECVVDLDRTSQPNQIVLALIAPKPTLAEAMEAVEGMIEKGPKKKGGGLGASQALLVPEMAWRISHHFTSLEGQEFTNTILRGQPITEALQDTQFRLSRYGAELKSEAILKAACAASRWPVDYIFDRPFLLVMKKRGAEMPYFVMWIENAELLNKWSDR